MDPDEIFAALDTLPALLQRTLDGLCDADGRRRSGAGGFAVVEHAWHLADLEAEGFGVRIARLLHEDDPELSDFDGAGVARARGYLELDPVDGLWRFQQARAANLATLGMLAPAVRERSGRQDGVGRVSLADLPRLMLAHDRSHAGELAGLLGEILPGHPALAALRAFGRDAAPASAQVA